MFGLLCRDGLTEIVQYLDERSKWSITYVNSLTAKYFTTQLVTKKPAPYEFLGDVACPASIPLLFRGRDHLIKPYESETLLALVSKESYPATITTSHKPTDECVAYKLFTSMSSTREVSSLVVT